MIKTISEHESGAMINSFLLETNMAGAPEEPTLPVQSEPAIPIPVYSFVSLIIGLLIVVRAGI